ADWPSPIVAVGIEAGSAAPYPDQSIEADYSWSPNHPIVAAYRAYREKQEQTSGATGVRSQAVLAALYAANTNADYLKVSQPGTIEVSDDGRTRFRESACGIHRYRDDRPRAERIRDAGLYCTCRRAAGSGPRDAPEDSMRNI